MMFDINKIVRNNIRNLTPYSSAREDFKGVAEVYLDANENSFGSAIGEGFNRYPDPLQLHLKKEIAKIKLVSENNIFVGNGSDEAIDILFRVFCTPGIDNIITLPPTYGMYGVSASINDVEVRKVNLTKDFDIDVDGVLNAVDEKTKLIFLCSPNNPTANLLNVDYIKEILQQFNGIVVVDEAYIDFSEQDSFIKQLDKYENLVVLQTFSKAWGLASLRMGMAFASKEIIQLYNKVKPPYNVNGLCQQVVTDALKNKPKVDDYIRMIRQEREFLEEKLIEFDFITKIHPSDSNFILVKTIDARRIYQYLVSKGIIVRDRSTTALCDGCIRITVGTVDENKNLLAALSEYC